MGQRRHRPAGALEPTVLLAALAAAPSHIGLIATASTTYNEPYNLARRFASLDHISGGRAGWNIVTTAGQEAAQNFGLDDGPAARDRYRRAAEFTRRVHRALGQLGGRRAGRRQGRGNLARRDQIHAVDHAGEYFRVRGPLNVPRSPQGRPLLVQAGSSEDGREFAARYAEAVFTAQQTLADAQASTADLKQRAAAAGRDPENQDAAGHRSRSSARPRPRRGRSSDELEELIVPEHALAQLAQRARCRRTRSPLDRRAAGSCPTEHDRGRQEPLQLIVDLARRERLTVRQLIGRLGGGRGHRTFAGTPEQVADTIAGVVRRRRRRRLQRDAARAAVRPGDFVDHVVPILRERGLFRTEYAGRTLRDHYGIPRPENQFAVSATRDR